MPRRTSSTPLSDITISPALPKSSPIPKSLPKKVPIEKTNDPSDQNVESNKKNFKSKIPVTKSTEKPTSRKRRGEEETESLPEPVEPIVKLNRLEDEQKVADSPKEKAKRGRPPGKSPKQAKKPSGKVTEEITPSKVVLEKEPEAEETAEEEKAMEPNNEKRSGEEVEKEVENKAEKDKNKQEKEATPGKGKRGRTPKKALEEKAKEEKEKVESGEEMEAKEEKEASPKKKVDKEMLPPAKKRGRKATKQPAEEKKSEEPPTKSLTARRSEIFNKIRQERVAERNKILSDMGLLQVKSDVQKIRSEISLAENQKRLEERRNRAEQRRLQLLERKRAREEAGEEPDVEIDAAIGEEVRRSGRIRKRPGVFYGGMGEELSPSNRRWSPTYEGSEDEYEEEEDEGVEAQPGRINRALYKYKKPFGPRPQKFGAISGVPVGEIFESREEANYAGIHRPMVAGISGNELEGAYSVCMSGGYEDDVDYGECFTYTGAGGRDLKGTKAKPKNLRTAPQSKNQSLSGMNLALAVSCEKKLPVRVMRGFKGKTAYAPSRGYRYDGLYTVEKFYETTGQSGFQVFCFIFKRIEEQDPPPWVHSEKNDEEKGEENEDKDEGKEDEDKENEKVEEKEEVESPEVKTKAKRGRKAIKKKNETKVDPKKENDEKKEQTLEKEHETKQEMNPEEESEIKAPEPEPTAAEEAKTASNVQQNAKKEPAKRGRKPKKAAVKEPTVTEESNDKEISVEGQNEANPPNSEVEKEEKHEAEINKPESDPVDKEEEKLKVDPKEKKTPAKRGRKPKKSDAADSGDNAVAKEEVIDEGKKKATPPRGRKPKKSMENQGEEDKVEAKKKGPTKRGRKQKKTFVEVEHKSAPIDEATDTSAEGEMEAIEAAVAENGGNDAECMDH